MKRQLIYLTIILILFSADMALAVVDYQNVKTMSQVVSATVKPFTASGPIPVPIITWGADVATILTKQEGYFSQEGTDVSLFKEDNFVKQVEACLSGRTPYIRGTMGMIMSAADAFKAKGVDLVVIYQMSWSNGGDVMVVRKGKKLDNVKTIGLQIYGPHMDYVSNLFSKVNRLSDVRLKWLSELTIQSGTAVVDPVSAFRSDAGLDAVMCISPDASMLTSGGTEGTGAEGSVKGAKTLLSTKTASRIIADVYAVRKDYFDSHKQEVQGFVKALMKGQETLLEWRKAKSQNYRSILGKSAEILIGSSQATGDVEGLLGDCEFVNHAGNVAFFTGQGTTRNFNTLTKEIQGYFTQIGILSGGVSVAAANWDYQGLATGLKYSTASSGSAAKTPIRKFDTAKVTAKIEKTISTAVASAEANTWVEEDTLFVVEIYFEPNQNDFPIDKYQEDFQKALEIAQSYAGAVVVIEGHADPQKILQAEKDRTKYKQADVEQMKQAAKNLTLLRAESVRQSFLQFCQENGIDIDESQFVAVGLGVSIPKFSPPRTKEEWAANRRVVFRIKQVEAEADEFRPIE